jgi:hypothetical protein
MPIVDITAVHGTQGNFGSGLAQAAADAIGNAIGAAPGTLWVRLHVLAEGSYAENNMKAEDTPRPVFVSMLSAAPPSGPALQEQARAIGQAVASVIGFPASLVHVEYAPAARGRLVVGGNPV